jgi:pSer/pThr/pTyr-binding forkhead associated (FHA) protein
MKRPPDAPEPPPIPDRDDPNQTIFYDSNVGKRLSQMRSAGTTYIVFQGRRVPLVGKIRLGRDKANDIVLEDKLASRRHAVIQKIGEEYFLEDLGSTNGTQVNGQRVPPRSYLRLTLTDTILIGRTELSLAHFK